MKSSATDRVRQWTLLVNLRRTDEPLVEYACHEGNYGLSLRQTPSRGVGWPGASP